MQRIRANLTYANVMATLAVFIALGGTALALGRNEVKSRHIAPGAVKRSDTNDHLRLKCPGGTRYHEGACIETAVRPTTAYFNDARSDCSDEGRRLPTVGELESFRLEPGIALSTVAEWTSHIFGDSAGFRVITIDEDGNYEGRAVSNVSDSTPYRCVAPAKR